MSRLQHRYDGTRTSRRRRHADRTVWVALTDAFVDNGSWCRYRARTALANEELASDVPAVLKGAPAAGRRGGVPTSERPPGPGAMRWSWTGAGNRPSRVPGLRGPEHAAARVSAFETWKAMWEDAREPIVGGEYPDRIFEDTRWNDPAVGP